MTKRFENQYEPYHPSAIDPQMVQYMDKTLVATSLWIDWIVLKSVLMQYVPQVQQRTGVTARRARNIVWNTFIAAIEGDRQAPLFYDVQQSIMHMSADMRPIFIARCNIALDIEKGMTEAEAEAKFYAWLSEDDHAIFGQFRLRKDFTTEEISCED